MKKSNHLGKIETVIREFVCLTQVGEQETNYNFKALICAAYDKPYRMRVFAQHFVSNSRVSRTEYELYFDKYEDLKQEFEYQYKLCKDNLFTTILKVIK